MAEKNSIFKIQEAEISLNVIYMIFLVSLARSRHNLSFIPKIHP